jgi:DNA recombination protein RmuC
VLAKTKKKLEEAQNNLDQAATRTRAMRRQLQAVEALPEDRVQALLGPALEEGELPGEGDA